MRHYTELLAKQKGLPAEQSKLYYYGSSYGTVLGGTYATLFPDRIARMILDGNLDVDDYYNGTWLSIADSTDNAAKTFFRTCFEAGPELCAFRGNASSADQLEKRYLKLYNDLKERPVLVSDPLLSTTPILVGFRELYSVFYNALYHSTQNFPSLAQTLAELEQRNGTLLAIKSGRAFLDAPTPPDLDFYSLGAARTHIACIDANGRTNLSTFNAYQNHIKKLQSQTFYGSNIYATIVTAPCRALGIKPPTSQVFKGKFDMTCKISF